MAAPTTQAVRNQPPHIYRKPVPSSSHRHAHHSTHTHRRQGVPSSNGFHFWRNLSRRTLILLAVSAAVLLILIIGLAAGLSSRHGTADLPLPSNHGGPYTGDLTYYATGLGACGITSSNGDAIVSISHLVFDAVQVGSNPNENPLCGKMIRVGREERSVDLKVVDRCTGCKQRDLDITEDTFSELADVSLGRVKMQWSWLDDVPSLSNGTMPN